MSLRKPKKTPNQIQVFITSFLMPEVEKHIKGNYRKDVEKAIGKAKRTWNRIDKMASEIAKEYKGYSKDI